jgi:polygalacturonase
VAASAAATAGPAADVAAVDAPAMPAWQRPEILTALITLLAAALGFAAGRSAGPRR